MSTIINSLVNLPSELLTIIFKKIRHIRYLKKFRGHNKYIDHILSDPYIYGYSYSKYIDNILGTNIEKDVDFSKLRTTEFKKLNINSRKTAVTLSEDYMINFTCEDDDINGFTVYNIDTLQEVKTMRTTKGFDSCPSFDTFGNSIAMLHNGIEIYNLEGTVNNFNSLRNKKPKMTDFGLFGFSYGTSIMNGNYNGAVRITMAGDKKCITYVNDNNCIVGLDNFGIRHYTFFTSKILVFMKALNRETVIVVYSDGSICKIIEGKMHEIYTSSYIGSNIKAKLFGRYLFLIKNNVNGTIEFWDVISEKLIRTIKVGYSVIDVSLRKNILVGITSGKTLFVINAGNGELIDDVYLGRTFVNVYYRGNGRFIFEDFAGYHNVSLK